MRRLTPFLPVLRCASITIRIRVDNLNFRSFPRFLSTAQDIENTNVSHARFIAESSSSSKWRESGKSGMQPTGEDFDTVAKGKGKLSPTSSHLFKLILPLGHLHSHDTARVKTPPPIVFLLHPSQPLSHIGRLIAASLAPATPAVSFRSTSNQGQNFRWSDATDLGDFIRDAARAAEFEISITATAKKESGEEDEETVIKVEVPTFADRTRFLRRRLDSVSAQLSKMERLKRACDREARRGARRVALGGFGMLVVYWAAVARLTFWDYGWDIMEPITYLSGLSTVILGYFWFLYQGREVSYSSVLHQSISARREALYKSRGFDIDRWLDLTSEEKHVRREISKIAEDYEDRRNETPEEGRERDVDKDNEERDVDEGNEVSGSETEKKLDLSDEESPRASADKA